MTNEKLIALLRQASAELSVLASYVEDPDTVWPNLGLKVTAKAQKKLRDSIDAALAAHNAAPAAASERPVTWESEPDGKFVKGYRADSLQIIITRLVSGRCEWNAWLDWEDDGEAATVEEAQAAAIKAVKEDE
jgi:plasmid stabilization system protein ParE